MLRVVKHDPAGKNALAAIKDFGSKHPFYADQAIFTAVQVSRCMPLRLALIDAVGKIAAMNFLATVDCLKNLLSENDPVIHMAIFESFKKNIPLYRSPDEQNGEPQVSDPEVSGAQVSDPEVSDPEVSATGMTFREPESCDVC